MSLYGNIKRIGSSTFQFDRIYSTRKEMDDNCITDGVYTGRYVLVEYGERYETHNVSSGTIPFVNESQQYSNNYNTDLEAYGNIYDSTVWQKIFFTSEDGISHEKYIMVAELNALAPQMTLIEDETSTLIATKNNDPELELFYGKNNNKLHGVKTIKANSPYFDKIRDTELQYILHMPRPMELDVNKEIDYHGEKFNIYKSYFDNNDSNGGNFIGWKPVLVPPLSPNAQQQYEISSDTAFSKYELNMYLPAFGDALGDLYDTLFGQAGVNGGIRPYFVENGLTEDILATFDDQTKQNDYSKISKILANNSQGLAGILSAVITDSSIPGQVRYYLSSDWLAKNDEKTNVPEILNKPRILFKNNANKTGDLSNSDLSSHYTIDYFNWTLTNFI